MATTQRKTATRRPPREAPASPSKHELAKAVDQLELESRRLRDDTIGLRRSEQRDKALLAVAVVYLACALVLVAYVYGRKSR